MAIYGYKTADSDSIMTSYTIQGFVEAKSLEEAERHFGCRSSGWDCIAELTEEQFAEEVAKIDDYRDKIQDAKREIAFYRKLIKQLDCLLSQTHQTVSLPRSNRRI